MTGVIGIMDAAWLRRERSGSSRQQPSTPLTIWQNWSLSQSTLLAQQRESDLQQAAPQHSGNATEQQPVPQQTPWRPQQPSPQQTGVSTKQHPSPCSTVQQDWPSGHVSGLTPTGQVIGSAVQVTMHWASVGCGTAALPFPPAKTGSVPPNAAQAAAQASGCELQPPNHLVERRSVHVAHRPCGRSPPCA